MFWIRATLLTAALAAFIWLVRLEDPNKVRGKILALTRSPSMQYVENRGEGYAQRVMWTRERCTVFLMTRDDEVIQVEVSFEDYWRLKHGAPKPRFYETSIEHVIPGDLPIVNKVPVEDRIKYDPGRMMWFK